MLGAGYGECGFTQLFDERWVRRVEIVRMTRQTVGHPGQPMRDEGCGRWIGRPKGVQMGDPLLPRQPRKVHHLRKEDERFCENHRVAPMAAYNPSER